MKKSYTVAPGWRGGSIPGQVPGLNPEQRGVMQLATAPAKPRDILADNAPRLTVSSVLRGLGLPWDQEKAWTAFLTEACKGPNEVAVRQALFSRFQTEGTDPELRRILTHRTLIYFRGMQKSMTRIVSISELRKAEARGGKYYRRVPHESGKGHRYIYDADKYHSRSDAHLSGEEVSHKRAHAAVQSHLEELGDKGGAPDDFKPVLEKHGKKAVDALREKVKNGDAHFHEGRFYAQKPGQKTPDTPEDKPKDATSQKPAPSFVAKVRDKA